MQLKINNMLRCYLKVASAKQYFIKMSYEAQVKDSFIS